jgi:Tol biopolymer transport system component
LNGNETPIRVPANRYDRLTISPDGERAVIAASGDIWLLEFDGRAMLQRLTSGVANDTAPIFAYDGDTIIFSSNRAGNAQLFEMPTEQNAIGMEPIQISPLGPLRFADAWVPDGERLIYTQLGEETGFDIGVGHLNPSQDVFFQPVVQSSRNEGAVSLSPDGRWVAYTTDEVEGGQLYVSSFPSFEGRYPISNGGGTEPVWAPDGSAIYFRKYPAMMRVDVEAGETFRAEAPVEIFSNPRFFANPQGARSYDVHPDGDRFLMIVPESGSEERRLYNLVVVENWFDELERLAPHPERN